MSRTKQDKKRELLKKLSTCKEFIKGSLVVNRRRCGKSVCRCNQGELHESFAFTYKKKGKSYLVHVPKHLEAEAKQANREYKKLKKVVQQISRLNIEILKSKVKRKSKKN